MKYKETQNSDVFVLVPPNDSFHVYTKYTSRHYGIVSSAGLLCFMIPYQIVLLLIGGVVRIRAAIAIA